MVLPVSIICRCTPQFDRIGNKEIRTSYISDLFPCDIVTSGYLKVQMPYDSMTETYNNNSKVKVSYKTH